MTNAQFRLFFFLIFLSSFTSVFAQVNKPVRLEIPVKDDSEIYKVVPCDQNGVMIIYLSSETDESGHLIWITALLDRNLKEIWRKPVSLPRGFGLAEALYSNNHFIGFWYSLKGNTGDNLRIVDIQVADTTKREVAYTVPEKAELSHFGICEHFALAGLNTKDNQSLFIRYDIQSGNITALNQEIEGSVVIESMNINPESGMVSAILRTTGSAKKRGYYLVKTDRNGQKISQMKLSKFDDSNMVNTAFAYKIDSRTDLIIGSYGKSSRTKNVNGFETTGVASTGFFSIIIQDNIEISGSAYEFSDFQNFYRYLRRPSDLSMRRSTSKAEKGSKDYSVDYDLLAHDVFKWKDSYVFIAEAYYPEYRTVTTMVYDYYGRPYPSTYSVFEGFRYLTTFIAGFDSTGNMKWNNDLELQNMLSQELRQKVLAWEDTDGLVLSYTYDAKIASKLLTDGLSASSSVSNTEIASLSSRDKVYSDANSNIVSWYGNYFLVYGYQNIRNSYQSSRNNKNVFYLNKIAFR
ncbi:MAG: hypothetical protein HGA37_03425 [Lentimicrobium sp.]|nr:hypothetical protein [Lentimicrobium sp.]